MRYLNLFRHPLNNSLLFLPALLLTSLAFTAAPAQAEETLKPWWHLTSNAQPSYIQPGQAKDEVQRLTVGANEGEYVLGNEGVESNVANQSNGSGYSENTDAEVGEEPEKLQEQLEGLYGAGNVEVTGGPGPGGRNPYEVYEVKFVGRLADRFVNPMLVQSRSLDGTANVKTVVVGRPDGTIVVTATNLGDASASPATQPITIKDTLPAGLTAVGIEASADESPALEFDGLECALGSLSCTLTQTPPSFLDEYGKAIYKPMVPPSENIQMRIAVDATGAVSGESNEAGISGGEAPAATVRAPITVSDAPVPFGVSSYEMRPEEVGGGLDTQAGSHPFQLTTALNLNQNTEGKPVAIAKDLHFELPPGLVGNPTPFPQCPLAVFLVAVHNGHSLCPADTLVGVSVGYIVAAFGGANFHFTYQDPVYNLEPAVGEPARFGFIVNEAAAGPTVPVLLNTSVRTGGDYGVTVTVHNISEIGEFVSSEVVFWGVPGDLRHGHGNGEGHPPPLLTLPASCTGPLHTTMEAASWLEPTAFVSLSNTQPMPALDGCDRLPFVPEIRVSPDAQQASKPTGLTVDVHVPQEGQLNGEGLAQSEIKNIVVTLPEGVTLNPSAADGLVSCSEAQIGFEGAKELEPVFQPGIKTLTFSPKVPGSYGSSEPLQEGVNFCPNASKIAEATIKTPLLPNPLKGFVYLASPQNFAVFPQENPFETHVAMYLFAEDPVSGSTVKLPGSVELGGQPGAEGLAPGQIRSTFANNPQLPFEDAELHFFGGERAPLASPNRCGAYTTSAVFTPWSGGEPIHSSSSFEITSGPNGTPCPGAALPFNPTLSSGTTNINAGAFTPLATTLSRPDGNQSIQSVTLHYPAGVSGLLNGVKLCGEAQANEGTCGPESEIGETIVSVGLGGDPFTVTGGKVYITGPYRGAPFGLSIVNPANAGPFDLQEGRPVVVRAKIEVDPHTAALTITTDPPGSPHAIPTIIEGFPLQIQHVNVLVNRPGFTFNPTNCDPQTITGAIDSAEGASSPVSDPFQVTNCASLKFAPKFAVSTSGKTSRASGASLSVYLSYPNNAGGAFDGPEGDYTNIARVKVELPKQLPSRLTTLQKACSSAQFESNPAGCPAASIVGHAKAVTPLLPVPLEGPAYFVSHGGEAFPSLIIVLQGYGVTVDLVGSTFINEKTGVTSSTFKTVPDAPVGSFELTLPEGKYSALAANANLCKQKKLAMPTEFVAQNGAEIRQSTKISVTGCAKTKHAKKRTKHAKKSSTHKSRHGKRRKG